MHGCSYCPDRFWRKGRPAERALLCRQARRRESGLDVTAVGSPRIGPWSRVPPVEGVDCADVALVQAIPRPRPHKSWLCQKAALRLEALDRPAYVKPDRSDSARALSPWRGDRGMGPQSSNRRDLHPDRRGESLQRSWSHQDHPCCMQPAGTGDFRPSAWGAPPALWRGQSPPVRIAYFLRCGQRLLGCAVTARGCFAEDWP